jgi:hypothetical protein
MRYWRRRTFGGLPYVETHQRPSYAPCRTVGDPTGGRDGVGAQARAIGRTLDLAAAGIGGQSAIISPREIGFGTGSRGRDDRLPVAPRTDPGVRC